MLARALRRRLLGALVGGHEFCLNTLNARKGITTFRPRLRPDQQPLRCLNTLNARKGITTDLADS